MFRMYAYGYLTFGLISVGMELAHEDYIVALSWLNGVIWCRVALDLYNKIKGE